MNDEDFVMGYVTGYNDGKGGGSSGGTPGIVIAKSYKFGNSGFGVGLFDPGKTGVCQRMNGSFTSWAEDYNTSNQHYIPGPLQGGTYESGYAAMQGDKIIGYCTTGSAIATMNVSWTHVNGVWEMSDPFFPQFKDEKIIVKSPGSNYDIEYYIEGTVTGTAGDEKYSFFFFGITRNPNNGKGLRYNVLYSSRYFVDLCSGDNMLGWYTALVENGITIEEV